jgi:hypothetical protein
MGCWHGYHGCGPWYGPPYERGYEPLGWYGEEDRPLRRRVPRARRVEPEAAAADLEARLAELRDELRHVEAELVSLRASDEAAAEKP